MSALVPLTQKTTVVLDAVILAMQNSNNGAYAGLSEYALTEIDAYLEMAEDIGV